VRSKNYIILIHVLVWLAFLLVPLLFIDTVQGRERFIIMGWFIQLLMAGYFYYNQMPDISGLQLLKSLVNKPLVILPTAYSNYAREGFDLDVVDYLLKPYSFDRFLRAVNKANDYLGLRILTVHNANTAKPVALPDFIFVKADYRLVRINLQDILYVEGLKDYVKIYLSEKPVVTQMSMKSLEEKLPSPEFIRVHRSYIVSFSKVESIQKNMLTIGKKEIPVSEPYREKLFSIINSEKSNQ